MAHQNSLVLPLVTNIRECGTTLHRDVKVNVNSDYFTIFTSKDFENKFSCSCFIAAITCPGLPPPTNGKRIGCSGNATEFYDTACHFGCYNGYIGSGSQSRRCQQNGTWSGQEFICASKSHRLVMHNDITNYLTFVINVREDHWKLYIEIWEFFFFTF